MTTDPHQASRARSGQVVLCSIFESEKPEEGSAEKPEGDSAGSKAEGGSNKEGKKPKKVSTAKKGKAIKVLMRMGVSTDIVEVQTFFEQFGAVMQAKAGMHQNRHEVCAMEATHRDRTACSALLLLLFVMFGLYYPIVFGCTTPNVCRRIALHGGFPSHSNQALGATAEPAVTRRPPVRAWWTRL